MVRLAFTILSLVPSLVLCESAGPCADSCGNSHPTASFCNGDETGSALDDCLCQSYLSAPDLIGCIRACPSAQVSAFAAEVPTKCRSTLFPGVNAAPAGTATTAATTSADETSGSASTTSASAGMTTATTPAVETLSSTGPPSSAGTGGPPARLLVSGRA